jgi:hypothetical protein
VNDPSSNFNLLHEIWNSNTKEDLKNYFVRKNSESTLSQIRYLYDEAISAGSDHAAEMSDLTYTS